MNSKTTAILASVLVIALASSAIIGVTYSWFEDKDEVKVSFTPGKIDISTTISALEAKNYGDSEGMGPGDDGKIHLGSGAIVSLANESNAYSINFNGVASGDSLKFTMTIKNDSSIKAKWMVDTGSYDSSIFKISIKYGTDDCNVYRDFTSDTVDVCIEISVDTEVSSISDGQTITITAKATQSSNPAIS